MFRKKTLVSGKCATAKAASGCHTVAVMRRSYVPLLVGAGLVALILDVTHGRPGLTVDSGEYLGAAKNLIHGHGLTVGYSNADEAFRLPGPAGQDVPLTQFPPLFPALVGLVALVLRCSVATAAGAVAAAGFGWVGFRLAQRPARSSAWGPVAVGGLLGCVPVIEPALMAWSESLKLVVLTEAGLAAAGWLETRAVWSRVRLHLAVGLAPLVHLTGFAAALSAGALLFFMTSGRSRWGRVLDAGSVVVTGLIPVAGWLVYGAARSGGLAQKHLGWYPTWQPGLLWCLAIVVVASAGVAVARGRRELVALSLSATAMFSVVILGLSRFTFDRNIALDRRQLQAAVVLTSAGWLLLLRPRLVPSLAAALLLAGPGLTIATASTIAGSEYLGYRAPRWHPSPLLDAVKAEPGRPWVLTNAPDAVALLTSEQPIGLPQPTNLFTGARNRDYGEQLAQLRCAAAGHDPVLAFFYRPTRGHSRSPDPLLGPRLRLRVTATYADGVLYAVDTGGCSAGSG